MAKFTLSTKPLSDALNLAVINSNISQFSAKSGVVQVTPAEKELKLNFEANSIRTEVTLRGVGEGIGEGVDPIFVSCLSMKNLVNTFDGPTVEMEFDESGLILRNAKSRFVLAKVLDTTDFLLDSPDKNFSAVDSIVIDREKWKFIQDHQLYARSLSYVNAAFTYVYVDENENVIVGDYDNSIFTHSKMNQLKKQCLLSDTIVNLINALPEGAMIMDLGDSYIIDLDTDAFHYVTQFVPTSEDDERAGNYNANIILRFFAPDRQTAVLLDKATISKFIQQSDMLADSITEIATFEVSNGILSISNKAANCKAAVQGNTSANYSLNFNTYLLKSMISHMDGDKVYINTIDRDGEPIGILMWTDNMEVVLNKVE